MPTEKQIVLAYLRSICYELYQKYRASSNMRSLHDMSSEAANIQPENGTTIFLESASGNELSIHDNLLEFSNLQKAIIEQNFSGHLYYASWTTETRLPLACFGLFNPIYDVTGNIIQHSIRQNNRFENVFIAIVPTPNGGKISIVSLRRCSRALQFIRSLLQDENVRIADFAVKTVMANSENHCCNPIWYEKLPPRKKKIVLEQMQQMFSLDSPCKQTPELIEDAARFEITNIDF